ncbi:MAG: PhzF family phenazine biosynthesis isomerase [Bdellovibrionota bacterium]
MKSSKVIYHVDSFTKEPFAGNPAGVCIMEEKKDSQWMQKIASEMNLSETAFLCEESDGYSIRFFTPTVEVDLCGHASLASSHILWEQGLVNSDHLVLQTRDQVLTIHKENELICMSFPAMHTEMVSKRELFSSVLGCEVLEVAQGKEETLVLVEHENVLKSIRPNRELIIRNTRHGLIVTCPSSNQEFDFVSRYFAPNVGIDEDPVTGVAHCVLTPYWAKKTGKTSFRALQASHRPGSMETQLLENRVLLKGYATTVMICTLVDQ